MGFSSIISTGIMVIVLIVAGYLVLATLNSAVDSATASQAMALDAREAQLHTSLSLSSPGSGTGYLDFNVTNDGDEPIEDVTCMDVFVRPIEESSVTSCQWLPYEDSAAEDSYHWYVLYQVKDAPGSATGLGPGDVMRVHCVLNGTAAPAMGEIIVAAAGGTTGTMLFNGPVW